MVIVVALPGNLSSGLSQNFTGPHRLTFDGD